MELEEEVVLVIVGCRPGMNVPVGGSSRSPATTNRPTVTKSRYPALDVDIHRAIGLGANRDSFNQAADDRDFLRACTPYLVG